jgi:hypothetical protein
LDNQIKSKEEESVTLLGRGGAKMVMVEKTDGKAPRCRGRIILKWVFKK